MAISLLIGCLAGLLGGIVGIGGGHHDFLFCIRKARAIFVPRAFLMD
jgi:hypothetical protein